MRADNSDGDLSQGTAVSGVFHMRTFTDGGTVTADAHVQCAQRGGTMPIATCETCPSCESIMRDARGTPREIYCRRDHSTERVPSPREGLIAYLPNVAELMTRELVAIRPGVSLESAVNLLASSGSQMLPVLNAEGRALGMLSAQEVLQYMQVSAGTGELAASSAEPAEAGMHPVTPGPTVKDVMAPLPLIVPESMNAAEAAALMAAEGQNWLLAENAAGQVVGLLAASDVLAWLGRTAGYPR